MAARVEQADAGSHDHDSGPSPHNPVEELPTHECWRLLRTTTVGRLAVSVDSQPDIFPVNYVVDHGTLVFRTDAGTKLTAALTSNAVAVEADGIERGIKLTGVPGPGASSSRVRRRRSPACTRSSKHSNCRCSPGMTARSTGSSG